MRADVALRLGRVSNLPTVWTNVLAGILLAGGELHTAVVALLLAGTSATYVAGMFLNDAFDRNIDARERPERPIPSGAVGAGQVFFFAFALLVLGFGLTAAAALVSPTANVRATLGAAGALAATVVLYDVVHKHTRLAVVLMAACRALVYVAAGFATAPQLAGPLAGGVVALFTYIVALTAVAAQENLAALRSAWALALLAVPGAIALYFGQFEPAGLAFAVLFCGSTLLSVRMLMASRTNVRAAVTDLIAGICLLDATFIGARGEIWLAVIAALGVVATRALQRVVPGT